MKNLSSELTNLVVGLRSGDYSNALSMLNIFLGNLTEKLHSGKINVDLKKLSYSFETLFMMQKNEDYVAMADILEYEIALLLGCHIFPNRKGV